MHVLPSEIAAHRMFEACMIILPSEIAADRMFEACMIILQSEIAADRMFEACMYYRLRLLQIGCLRHARTTAFGRWRFSSLYLGNDRVVCLS